MVWRSCTPFSWMRGAAEPRPLLPHAYSPPAGCAVMCCRRAAMRIHSRVYVDWCADRLPAVRGRPALYYRPTLVRVNRFGLADTSGTRLSLLCATTWLSWAAYHAKRTWSTCARRCAPQRLPSHTCLPCSSVGIWSDSSHARIGANRHGPCAYTDFLVRYLFA